jgi:hypothetical protein
MDLSHLATLFREAKKLTKHREFVVIGSLCVLGIVRKSSDVPKRMLMSIDVDCYTKDDPGRIFELKDKLGQGSPFEAQHGFYLDPVSPEIATLPDHWAFRLIPVELGEGIVAHFLDPNDAAVSKYARCEPRDREWIRAGLGARLLSAPVIESRFRQTAFLDDAERQRASKAFSEDAAACSAR